jgi:hypothetical protein
MPWFARRIVPVHFWRLMTVRFTEVSIVDDHAKRFLD